MMMLYLTGNSRIPDKWKDLPASILGTIAVKPPPNHYSSSSTPLKSKGFTKCKHTQPIILLIEPL